MRTKAIKNKWGLDRSAPEKQIKAAAPWKLLAAAATSVLFFTFVTTVGTAVDFVDAILRQHHIKRLNKPDYSE